MGKRTRNNAEGEDSAQLPGFDAVPAIPHRSAAAQRFVVHSKKGKFDVYIGRPSIWGNPFVIGPDGNREEVIRKYREWLPTQEHLVAGLPGLRGRILGCFCAPLACHGDVLAELANPELEESTSER